MICKVLMRCRLYCLLWYHSFDKYGGKESNAAKFTWYIGEYRQEFFGDILGAFLGFVLDTEGNSRQLW